MSMFRAFVVAVASVALLAGAPASVAQRPGDRELAGGQGAGSQWGGPGWGGGDFNTRGLEGVRVDSAKDQLRRSGFNYTRAIRENGKQYDLWSNGRSCVGFSSYNGRVSDVRGFRDAECGDITGGRGRINVRELQGLGVDAAKNALRRADFSYSRSIRVSGRQYDLWSGYGRRSECVGFTSYNGRVTDARTFSDREC